MNMIGGNSRLRRISWCGVYMRTISEWDATVSQKLTPYYITLLYLEMLTQPLNYEL